MIKPHYMSAPVFTNTGCLPHILPCNNVSVILKVTLTSSCQHEIDLIYSSAGDTQVHKQKANYKLLFSSILPTQSRCYFSQTSWKRRHERSTPLAVFQSVWPAENDETVNADLFCSTVTPHCPQMDKV